VDKVNIYAIIDSNKKAIEDLHAKLQQNVPYEKLANELLVKTFVRDSRKGGIINSYLSPEKPFLGEAAFKLKVSETAGPIAYNDPEKGLQYALIKCIVRTEEKQLEYKDVEKTIVKKFVEVNREKITRSNAEQLKQKYKVIIYEDVLTQNLGINP